MPSNLPFTMHAATTQTVTIREKKRLGAPARQCECLRHSGTHRTDVAQPVSRRAHIFAVLASGPEFGLLSTWHWRQCVNWLRQPPRRLRLGCPQLRLASQAAPGGGASYMGAFTAMMRQLMLLRVGPISRTSVAWHCTTKLLGKMAGRV